jgi:hypothetical protein
VTLNEKETYTHLINELCLLDVECSVAFSFHAPNARREVFSELVVKRATAYASFHDMIMEFYKCTLTFYTDHGCVFADRSMLTSWCIAMKHESTNSIYHSLADATSQFRALIRKIFFGRKISTHSLPCEQIVCLGDCKI